MGEVARVSPDMFHLGLTADLGDVQANLTALLASQLNRSERCGERLSLERASLVPAPPSGLLKASFHYERWACAKVLGKEVAKRLAGGNGVLEVLLTLFVASDSISLTSEVRKIDADGSLGELLRAGSLGASVKEKIAASVQSAIQKAANFKTILPRVVETAVTIRSVQFAEREDRLLLSLAADVRITPDQWQLLAKQFAPR